MNIDAFLVLTNRSINNQGILHRILELLIIPHNLFKYSDDLLIAAIRYNK